MERKFTRIVSAMMSVVMFVFTFMNGSYITAEDTISSYDAAEYLKILQCSIKLNGSELTGTTEINNGDEFELYFSWEEAEEKTLPPRPATFVYDLSDSISNINMEALNKEDGDIKYQIIGKELRITIKNGDTGRDGSCTVSGKVDLSDSSLNENGKVEFKFLTKKYEVEVPSLHSNLSISKTAGSLVKGADGKYYQHFDVKIENTSTQNATNIKFGDSFVSDDNSVYESNALYNLTIGGTAASLNSGEEYTIPSINAGETVNISYDLMISPDKALAGKSANNTASVDFNDGAKDITRESSVTWINFPTPEVHKSGTLDAAANTVSWNITVKPKDFLADTDFVVTDTLDYTYIDSSFDLAAATGGSGTNPVTIPKDKFTLNADGSYTLTYTTPLKENAQDTVLGATVSNKANVKFDGLADEKSSTANVGIPAKGNLVVEKTFDGRDSEGNLQWNIKVKVPYDPSLKSFKITDETSNYKYSYSHKIDFSSFDIRVNGVSENFTVTNANWDQSIQDYFFFLEFGNGKNDISKIIKEGGAIVEISYKSVPDAGNKGVFFNIVKSEIPGTTISGTDEVVVSPEFTASKMYTGSSDSRISNWKINIKNTSAKIYSAGDKFVVTDTIPDDFTYVENSARCRVTWRNDIIPSVSVSGNKATFTLELTADMARDFSQNDSQDIDFTFSLEMDEEAYSELVFAGVTSHDVVNNAKVSNGTTELDISGIGNLPVNPAEVLNKKLDGEIVKNDEGGVNTFAAKYSIDVNAEAIDLIPGTDDLELVDTLGRWFTLDESSIVITPSVGTSYSYDSKTRQIKFRLKDKTTYKITYGVTGKLVGNNIDLDAEHLSNTVTLKGLNNTQLNSVVTISSSDLHLGISYNFEIKLSGEKVWVGDNENIRPDEISFDIMYKKYNIFDELIASGVTKNVKVKPDADNKWLFSENLTARDVNGDWYEYLIKETDTNGYTVTYKNGDSTTYDYSKKGNQNITITNTFDLPETEVGTVKVNKSWDDKGYEDKRPEKITFRLMKGDSKVAELDLLKNQSGITFDKIPVYDYSRDADGNLVKESVEYKIVEFIEGEAAQSYDVEYDDTCKKFTLTVGSTKEMTVTNKIKPDVTTSATSESTTPESEPATTESTTPESEPATTESTTPESEPTTTESTTPESEPTTTESTTPESEPTTTESTTPVSEPTTTESTTPESEPTTTESTTPESEPTTTESTTPESEPTTTESTTPESEPTTTESTTPESEPATTESTTPESEPATSESKTASSTSRVTVPVFTGSVSTTSSAKVTTTEKTTTEEAVEETTKKTTKETTTKEEDETTITEKEEEITTTTEENTTTTLPADGEYDEEHGDFGDNPGESNDYEIDYEVNPNTGVSIPITLIAGIAFGVYAAFPRKKKA